MSKEKLKTLFNEYREISNNLTNAELKEADLKHEDKNISEEADKLNKQLDNKFNEIMEFIEEMV